MGCALSTISVAMSRGAGCVRKRPPMSAMNSGSLVKESVALWIPTRLLPLSTKSIRARTSAPMMLRARRVEDEQIVLLQVVGVDGGIVAGEGFPAVRVAHSC